MEENENKENNVQETVSNETTNSTVNNSILSKIKEKKGLILGIVVAVIAVLIVIDILFTSPKEAVKKYISLNNSAHTKKADKYYDYAGAHVFAGLDKDEYEDFWEEYKEYKKSDEWEEYKEDLEDRHDDEYYEEQDEDIKDSDYKIKIKKINNVKKVGKNLYRVSVTLEMKDEDDEKDTKTIKYYVMKSGLKSYVVGTKY